MQFERERRRVNFPRIFRRLSFDAEFLLIVIGIDRLGEKWGEEGSIRRGSAWDTVKQMRAMRREEEQFGWKFPSDEIRHLYILYIDVDSVDCALLILKRYRSDFSSSSPRLRLVLDRRKKRRKKRRKGKGKMYRYQLR